MKLLLCCVLSHYMPLKCLQYDDKCCDRHWEKGKRQKERDVCGVFLVSVLWALGVAEKKRSYSIEDDVFGSDTKATVFEDVSRAPASVWGRWINMNWWKPRSLWHVKCAMLFIVEGWCQLKSQALFLRAVLTWGGRSQKCESQEFVFVNNCTLRFISNTVLGNMCNNVWIFQGSTSKDWI